ncbi:MAG TPA: hypothetical protein VGN56_01330 [Candidatus Paceibacterota bacterium]|nr:hypothetical protein [Candidatus Paceibacterota bacterium]
MRITLGTRSLILGTLFLASFFVLAPTAAHAQTAAPTTGATQTLIDDNGNAFQAPLVTPASAAATAPTATTPTAAATPAATPSAASGGASCSAFSVGSWGDCLLDAVAFFILGLANFILGIVGVLLNWIVVKTVFQFSTLIGNSAGLITAWGILRDIGNLLLLFGFVLMGIGTILDTNKLPDKRAIPKLIIFAILLNFSIFAAEAVIDTSNVLTTVLYSQANTNPCVDDACNINNGIAGHIMQATGLSGIYALGGAKDIGGTSNKLVVILGLSLFATVGIVVLLATAMMLAFRAIVLTGLIIVSPIGFAGMALPKPFDGMAKKWWNMLIHQAFFAPILFLLIFVDLKVTEGFSSTANNNNLASALTGAAGTSNMGIIMVFALISGGLIAALMAAKSFGAMGADYAIKTASNVAFGSNAMLMRNTVGFASAKAGRFIRSTPIGTIPVLGKSLSGLADKGANSSFDARAKFGDSLKKAAKIDLGKPDKRVAKGYAGIEKEKTEDLVKYSKSLKLSDGDQERKDELDTMVKTDKENKDKRDGTLKERRSLFVSTDKKIKDDWKTREQELSAKIAPLEAKVAENKDNAQVSKLDMQISAEKLNAQRLRATGTVAESLASENKAKDLERQRDEYVAAEGELTKARDQRTQELDTYNQAIRRVAADIAKVDEESRISEAEYARKSKETADELDSLNLQKQFAKNLQIKGKIPILGGRPDKDAAKRIQADLNKTKGEQAIDKLRAAIESKADNAADVAAETLAAVKEADEEEKKEEA